MPYLTPDNPADSVSVGIEVPDTLLPHVVGAIVCLSDPKNWEAFGNLTVTQTIDLVNIMLQSIQENAGAGMKNIALVARANNYFQVNEWDQVFIPFDNVETASAFTPHGEDSPWEFDVLPGEEGYYLITARLVVNNYPVPDEEIFAVSQGSFNTSILIHKYSSNSPENDNVLLVGVIPIVSSGRFGISVFNGGSGTIYIMEAYLEAVFVSPLSQA